MNKRVAIIGSGFAGMSAACHAAQSGARVEVFEKNNELGGRARTFTDGGYTFDMGPSWYWMPDIFDQFFGHFGKKTSDYYELIKLDPGFTIFFGKGDVLNVPGEPTRILEMFEQEEKGGAARLRAFLSEAETKYYTALSSFLHKPSTSITEYLSPGLLFKSVRLDLFKSFRAHASRYFSSPRLRQLVEFPILFLGGTAQNIPALYSLMNYAAFVQGTWYPMGGFSSITWGMTRLAADLGVTFRTSEPVNNISVEKNRANTLHTRTGNFSFDGIIGAADYAHTETLLPPQYRNYTKEYWNSRTMSPSSLIFYIGCNKKITALQHHNLFFDKDFDTHAREIYHQPSWPSAPLFYVCCPSKTDNNIAPAGHENLFILMPLAPGITDTDELREKYFGIIMDRLENITGEKIRPHIDYKKSYCINDFVADYNSYKGNAYGLANTLRQTALLKPSLKNKKLNNLFYCGQLTVPGPGVPPALISGQIAATQLLKSLKS